MNLFRLLKSFRARRVRGLIVFLILMALAGVIHLHAALAPPPPGTYFRGSQHPALQLELFSDDSWLTADGERQLAQSIFDEAIRRIQSARRLVLVDMFLFNDFQGPVAETTRSLSSELVQALRSQKQAYPDLRVVVITDPINTIYGGLPNQDLLQLETAGVDVVLTDLTRLKNSNAVYSFFWRWLVAPFGNEPGDTLPSPFGEGRVTLRSYLSLLNFKANHRKVLINDSPDGWQALVSSANPHDGSSAHRNVAFGFSGPAVRDLLVTENAVLTMSGSQPLELPPDIVSPTVDTDTGVQIQVLTERRIKEGILETVVSAGEGDQLDLLMFYLADRDVIKALKSARARGVDVRVILDVNSDAFGRQKNGVPNKPVAHELHAAGIPVRWCSTRGEQCHAKMLMLSTTDTVTIISGSANLTRRNLDNFNLESDVRISGQAGVPALQQARALFARYWSNTDDRVYTVEYAKYKDERRWLRWLYRIMEFSGLSTF